jgi:hypothetical protein
VVKFVWKFESGQFDGCGRFSVKLEKWIPKNILYAYFMKSHRLASDLVTMKYGRIA